MVTVWMMAVVVLNKVLVLEKWLIVYQIVHLKLFCRLISLKPISIVQIEISSILKRMSIV